MRGDRKELKWSIGVDKNFNLLKQNIIEQPILALLDFNKVFQVDCYASGIAIGAILSQEGRPIAYFSQKLNDTKRKDSIYDQEFYTIVQALNKWGHYLLPKDFVLYTNHQAF